MKRALRWVELVLSLVLLGAAAWIIYRTVREFGARSVELELEHLSPAKIALGLALATMLHCFMTLYDFAALRYLRIRMPRRQVFLAGLLAYIFGNSLGMANLGSGAVRYRLYSSFKQSPQRIAQIIGVIVLANWLGFLLISGLAFVLFPSEVAPRDLPFRLPLSAIGWLSIGLVVAYGAFSALRRQPFQIRKLRLVPPRGAAFLLVVAVACVDFALPGMILYLFVPGSLGLDYGHFLALYLLGHLLGTLSQVPGDLGVIEGALLLTIPESARSPALISAFVVYRAIYFLVPLVVGLLLLAGFEAKHQRSLHSSKARPQARAA